MGGGSGAGLAAGIGAAGVAALVGVAALTGALPGAVGGPGVRGEAGATAVAGGTAVTGPVDLSAAVSGSPTPGVTGTQGAPRIDGVVVPSAPGAGTGSVASGEARWRWPLEPRPPVLRTFVAPLSVYGAGHRGLDLAASPDALVLAVEGGRVTHAGLVAGRGTVTVEHEDGLRSTYEPVDPGVRRGDTVDVGDSLGVVQPTGLPGAVRHCGSATCLHLGARLGPAYVDPLPLLTSGRLALLPLGTGG